MEILLEDINSKFELVLEGHAALDSKLDAFRQESNQKHDDTAFILKTLNTKIDDHRRESTQRHDETAAQLQTLDTKIDAIDESLSAHRSDTEVHNAYQVRED